MKPSRDPLYKAACRISRRLADLAEQDADNAEATLLAHYQNLEQYCLATAAQLRRVRTCADRGWSVSLRRCSGVLRPRLDTLFEQVKYLVYKPPDPFAQPRPAPRPDLILSELKQLEREFDGVEIDKAVISVTTEPIRLEDVPLGPFSIRLHVDRMNGRRGSHCLDCVALEPNPASTNDSVTHPHVDDEHLCAGEAAVPISAALSEGRLCDAFLLVAAVLRHYNPTSPYVALEHWDGIRCPDCDRTREADDMDCCGACQRRVCNDCSGCCAACQEYFCENCLERDRVAREHYCPNCRSNCRTCGRVVNREDLVEELGLCPQCHDREQEGQRDEEEQVEEEHNAPDPAQQSPLPVPSQLPGANTEAGSPTAA